MEQNPPGRRCNKCGTALSDETTGGLCPRCLMEMNLASRTMPGGEPSPQIPPTTPEVMAARFPQFEILECLGRGGMGIVYKARQKTLDRLVAIKVLAGERHDDPQFEARFEKEARTLAKLSHPNIVTVHDFGESDGMFYLVMEFVDGVNLRDVLRDGRMEPEQALAIVPEICAALQFAHDHGVVHRDIKPENILIDRDGRVKIADFGIAALVGSDADQSGTPPYMAPEQHATGGSIDHRADIYALGVVLYEMLTGERPEQDPSKPSHRVEIDVRLDEIVLRALEKEPARRYQTAGEFRTVVETMAASPAAPATTAQVQPKGLWAALKAGKPEAEWEGRAPGWRIRCRSCGFIEHFGKYGIRMAAAGTKWTLGRCQRCRRIRIHVIEKGPVPVGQALPGAYSQATHSPRRGIVMVGRRGGKAVINWPGVVLVFLMILPIVLAGGALFDLALHGPVTAMGMITSVCVALLVTGGALGRARSTPLERLVDLDEPPGSQAQAARLSRTAILGAIFAYIFFLTVFLKFFREGGAGLSGLSQFFGAWTMILGYVALQQIRRSAGSLHGLGLALFDVLLFPLLVLNAAIYLGVGNLWRANPPEVSHPLGAFLAQNEFLVPLFALALCAVVDLRIVHWAWRAANKPVDDEAPGIAMRAASFSWQSHIMFSVMVGVTVAAVIVLMRQLPKIGSWAEEQAKNAAASPAKNATPDHAARAFMEAIRDGDMDAAMKWVSLELKQKEKLPLHLELASKILRDEVYVGQLDRLTQFAESEFTNVDGTTMLMAVRVTPPTGDQAQEAKHGPVLILSSTPDGWRVAHFGEGRTGISLSEHVKEFLRNQPGKYTKNAIIGKWLAADEKTRIEFFPDGTMSIFDGLMTVGGHYAFLDDGRVKTVINVSGTSAVEIIQVSVSGDVMTTIDERGNKQELKLMRMDDAGADPPETGKNAPEATRLPEDKFPPEGAEIGRFVLDLPVQPPLVMPKDSPLTIEQVKEVLKGVTWGELLSAMEEDGKGDNIAVRENPSPGGKESRYEIAFRIGKEPILMDLSVDWKFRSAEASHLRPTSKPDQGYADSSEFLPQLAVRYAMKSGHAAAAPAVEEARAQARQLQDSKTLKQYATALMIYRDDTGSFTTDMATLLDGDFPGKKRWEGLQKSGLMRNHQTSRMERPIYHGSKDLRIEDHQGDKFILLAAPSADPQGKRLVAHLDGSVKILDESAYQKQVAAQASASQPTRQEPPP